MRLSLSLRVRVLLLLLLDLLLLLLVDVRVGERVCRRAHRARHGRGCERVRDRAGEVGVRERVGGCDAFRGVKLEEPVEEVNSWRGAYIFYEQVITFPWSTETHHVGSVVLATSGYTERRLSLDSAGIVSASARGPFAKANKA